MTGNERASGEPHRFAARVSELALVMLYVTREGGGILWPPQVEALIATGIVEMGDSVDGTALKLRDVTLGAAINLSRLQLQAAASSSLSPSSSGWLVGRHGIVDRGGGQGAKRGKAKAMEHRRGV